MSAALGNMSKLYCARLHAICKTPAVCTNEFIIRLVQIKQKQSKLLVLCGLSLALSD